MADSDGAQGHDDGEDGGRAADLGALFVEDEVTGIGLVRPQLGKLEWNGSRAWVIAVDSDGC